MKAGIRNSDCFLEITTAFFVTFIALCHSINAINKQISFILSLIMIAIIIVKRVFERKKTVFYATDVWWLLLLLVFTFHRDPNYASISTAFFFLGWLMMFVLRSNIIYYKGVIDAIFVFSLINLIANIISIVSPSLFHSIITSLRVMNANIYTAGTMSGLGSGIGRNAYFCVAGFSVGLSILLTRKRKKLSVIMYLAAMIIILLSTGKFGHTLFTFAAVLVVYLLITNSVSKKIQNLIIVIIVISMFVAISSELFPIVENFFTRLSQKSTSGDFSTGRIYLWQRAIEVFKSHPWFGIGYGAFSVNSYSITNVAEYAGVHNDYLQWLCETGIVGFLINMAIMISTFSMTIKVVKVIYVGKEKNGSIEQFLVIWSLFFQAFVMLYSLSGIPHFSYEISTIYYISCGIPFCIASNCEEITTGKHAIIIIGTRSSR